MLLSIPILALMKIVFDNVNELKPWGYLLGDEDSTEIDEDLNSFLANKKAIKRRKKPVELDENIE